MKQIINFFKQYTDIKYFRLAMLGFFFASILIDNKWFGTKKLIEITKGIGMIDMQMFNSASGIIKQLSQMGIEGRIFYERLLFLDFAVIFLFGIFQIISILRFVGLTRISRKWEYLAAFPLLRGILDAIENILLFFSSHFFPLKNVFLLKLTTVIIFTKWIFFWITIVIIFGMIFFNLFKRLIHKRQNQKSSLLAPKKLLTE
jgi:hypothetical protein